MKMEVDLSQMKENFYLNKTLLDSATEWLYTLDKDHEDTQQPLLKLEEDKKENVDSHSKHGDEMVMVREEIRALKETIIINSIIHA